MWPVTGFFLLHDVFDVPPCCSMYQYVIPFNCQIIFHCMGIPHFISLSVDGFWAVLPFG